MAKANDPALPHVLWSLQASLWLIARLVAPVLPTTAQTIRTWIADSTPLTWPVPTEGRVLDQTPALVASVPSPIFPRLDDKAQAAIVAKVLPDVAVVKPADAAPAPSGDAKPAPKPKADKAAKPDLPLEKIPFTDFEKLELRVGKVVSAAAVPKAKKLLHLHVDLGEAEPRSIVAGIAEAFTPEALVGKQVIVVANLLPVTIRDIPSNGMILAAGGDAILGLSAVDADVPPGTRVR
jgi:methionyl-tRNA synthetase